MSQHLSAKTKMTTSKNDMMVTAGVDTHKDTHTAAALDCNGLLLGVAEFPATAVGDRRLFRWLGAFGPLDCIGVEGTGSYGGGLNRFFQTMAVRVVEVNRPNHQRRRRLGKSDSVNAEAAARADLSCQAFGTPKSQDGQVESIRLLRSERRSAIKARTQAANQIHAEISTAPEILRQRFRGMTLLAIVKSAAALRVAVDQDATLCQTVRYVLRGLSRRWRYLDEEIGRIDKIIAPLVQALAPDLLDQTGVGVEVAGARLVAVGDNPDRLKNEASFAALCGASPVDASSGRQHRHRLNRGGNRDANRALWVIAFCRMRCDARTKEYAQKRTQEGLSRIEILRCLKRYIAREVYKILLSSAATREQESPARQAS